MLSNAVMSLVEIEKNLECWLETISSATSVQELERLKADIIGKSGVLTSAFKLLKDASAEEKKSIGEKLK